MDGRRVLGPRSFDGPVHTRALGPLPVPSRRFERMRGLPQERAVVSDAITIEWTGNRIGAQPIRPKPCTKESNGSLRSSSVTVVSWHICVTLFQRYNLNHDGPARPGPPRVSAGTLHVHCVYPDRLSDPPARCPRGIAMTRRPRISGGSARTVSSKAGPLVSVVGAPAAGSVRRRRPRHVTV